MEQNRDALSRGRANELQAALSRELEGLFKNGCFSGTSNSIGAYRDRFEPSADYRLLIASKVSLPCQNEILWISALGQISISRPQKQGRDITFGWYARQPFPPCKTCKGSGYEGELIPGSLPGIPEFLAEMEADVRAALERDIYGEKFKVLVSRISDFMKSIAAPSRYEHQLVFRSEYILHEPGVKFRVPQARTLASLISTSSGAVETRENSLMLAGAPCKICGGTGVGPVEDRSN